MEYSTCPECGSEDLAEFGESYDDFGDRIKKFTCRDCNISFEEFIEDSDESDYDDFDSDYSINMEGLDFDFDDY